MVQIVAENPGFPPNRRETRRETDCPAKSLISSKLDGG